MIFVSDISLVDAFRSVSGGAACVQTCNLGMIFPTSVALGSGPTSTPVMPDTVVDFYPAVAAQVQVAATARVARGGSGSHSHRVGVTSDPVAAARRAQPRTPPVTRAHQGRGGRGGGHAPSSTC